MSKSDTVVVEVPVTLRIAVAFPDGSPADPAVAAKKLAEQAAKSLTHVSHPQLCAFNEVNRVHPFASGVLESVEAHTP